MNTDHAAKIVWDYHHMHMPLRKADCIFVLCSNDLRVADHAAELYLQGYAPKILFSGGIAHKGDLLQTRWKEPEAVVFANRASTLGVPKKDILLESKATNTGENITFSKPILKKINAHSVIIVQKPFMERRSYATIKKIWPQLKFTISTPDISFNDYLSKIISKDKLINILIGDLQRIMEYPKKGYQIRQLVPANVRAAYKFLIGKGYTKHLMKQ